MPNEIRFFDEAARVGEEIFAALSHEASSGKIRSYFELSEKIYNLMVDVHDEVANLTVRVSLTSDLDEARHALSRLDHDRLADVFRVHDWCDEFEWLGNELAPLADELGLSQEDRDIWEEFCHSLSEREGEVAELYNSKLYDLRRLSEPQHSLDFIKDTVDHISETLVTQKAKFDLLAKKARAMRHRMK